MVLALLIGANWSFSAWSKGSQSAPTVAKPAPTLITADTELMEHLCEDNRDLPILERYWRAQEQAGTSTKEKQ